MTEEYGGLLHPQISLDDKNNLKIADIGTGTWLEPLRLLRTRSLAYSDMLMQNFRFQHLAYRTQPHSPTNRFHRRCGLVTGAVSTQDVASEERQPDRPRCLSAVPRINGGNV